jgi:hypothetical protein
LWQSTARWVREHDHAEIVVIHDTAIGRPEVVMCREDVVGLVLLVARE